MSAKSFDDLQLGDASELRRTITREDVERFVALSGDDNPLHVDPQFASRTDLKEPVVHGMLTGNLVSTLIGRSIPGPGSLWLSQELQFLAPVRVGDSLVVSARVIGKHERERLVDLDIRAHVDGRGEVLRGRGTVKLLTLTDSESMVTDPKPARRALITGASGEIGSAIARDLARAGFHIIAQYNSNEHSARKLQNEIEEFGAPCDLLHCNLDDARTVLREIEDALSRYGVIDTYVAAAAANIFQSDVLETTELEIKRALQVQLHTNHSVIGLLAPQMAIQGWGRIVAVSTDAAHSSPPRGWFSYVLSKIALEALVRQCAIELGPSGITSNVVSPGMTDTIFVSNISPRARKVVAQSAPNRRLGRPSDVAHAVSYLCGMNAGHVNGQTLRINGGLGFN